jgi:uncharacterized damage-inducible protein DinB
MSRAGGRFVFLYAVAAAVVVAPPVGAQQVDVIGEALRDVASLERRILSLQEAMAGKYDWRPAAGVRSAGEVYLHIASSNLMLPVALGLEPPAPYQAKTMEEQVARMQEIEALPAERIRELLEQSFAHVRRALESQRTHALGETVELFGRPVTRHWAIQTLVTHMHEHLGQSIAYARMNGVVPPWSTG